MSLEHCRNVSSFTILLLTRNHRWWVESRLDAVHELYDYKVIFFPNKFSENASRLLLQGWAAQTFEHIVLSDTFRLFVYTCGLQVRYSATRSFSFSKVVPHWITTIPLFFLTAMRASDATWMCHYDTFLGFDTAINTVFANWWQLLQESC